MAGRGRARFQLLDSILQHPQQGPPQLPWHAWQPQWEKPPAPPAARLTSMSRCAVSSAAVSRLTFSCARCMNFKPMILLLRGTLPGKGPLSEAMLFNCDWS